MKFAALFAVIVKEFRQLLRDKRMLPLLLVAPLIQIIVFGYAVNFDVNNINTSICDFDNTYESRLVQQRILADNTFILTSATVNCLRPDAAIRKGDSQAVIIIPKGFSRLIFKQAPTDIQVLVDGTNPIVGKFAANAIEQFFTTYNMQGLKKQMELLRARNPEATQGSNSGRVLPAIRMLFNPEMKSSVYMVPGVSALVLLVVTMIATAMGLAREKEMGTLEQVIVTPIGKLEFLLGKIIPFVFFGLFDLLGVLILSIWLFRVPMQGQLWLFFFGTILYLFNTVGIGLLVSTLSRNQQQALLTGFLVLMPAILLSGIMTPITSMPRWLQPVTMLNPMRYYGEVLRSVMLKGSEFHHLIFPLLGLLGFGIGLIWLASTRFSKQMD